MKIKEIRVVEIELNPKPTTSPRTPSRASAYPMNRPISRYPTFDKKEADVSLEWKRPACIVTAEDGTWGFGISLHGGPVTRIITDYFAPRLVGENCMATEKLWDMMVRSSTAFGATGLISYAISAVDCGPVGSQRQNSEETCLRIAGRTTEGENFLLRLRF